MLFRDAVDSSAAWTKQSVDALVASVRDAMKSGQFKKLLDTTCECGMLRWDVCECTELATVVMRVKLQWVGGES